MNVGQRSDGCVLFIPTAETPPPTHPKPNTDRRLEDDPERLPATGYGPAFEAAVSSIFVQPVETRWGQFGTRSQTVLAVWADGRGELRERYLQQDGSWQQLRHAFRLPPVQQEGGGGGEQWGDGGEQEVQV